MDTESDFVKSLVELDCTAKVGWFVYICCSDVPLKLFSGSHTFAQDRYRQPLSIYMICPLATKYEIQMKPRLTF